MISTADLKSQTRKELAGMAKEYGVPGWHGMKKDDLVAEIRKVQRRMARKRGETAKTAKPAVSETASKSLRSAAKSGVAKALKAEPADKPPRKSVSAKRKTKAKAKRNAGAGAIAKMPAPKVDPTTARIRAQLRRRHETMERHRDLTSRTLVGGTALQNSDREDDHRDRVVLMVRDSYWLQANWEITAASVERVKVALAQRWHLAKPTLRLLAVGDADQSSTESVVRDIQVHGGVDNWYIDVDEPPSRYRVLIGYSVEDTFHAICRSNVVETPRVGECERLDEHWKDIAEDYERIYSLSGGYDSDDGDLKEVFEQRMHRSMPLRSANGGTIAEPSLLKQTKMPFAVEAELIVFGKSVPGASISVAGNPVKTKADGSFTVRMELPDKRQVLPVSAESQDGLQQRTTVIAIERNTKNLEPVTRDELFQ